MSKPFACRIGLHSWYVDSALLASAIKCNDCGKAQDSDDAAKLDTERARLESAPADATLGELYVYALGLKS